MVQNTAAAKRKLATSEWDESIKTRKRQEKKIEFSLQEGEFDLEY